MENLSSLENRCVVSMDPFAFLVAYDFVKRFSYLMDIAILAIITPVLAVSIRP